ncbi:hypothetical protein GM30_14895 [Trabulsiella odontotermitis]|nr:hypothetical protein GM30_14895 [Trabulsiella odontotermitis]
MPLRALVKTRTFANYPTPIDNVSVNEFSRTKADNGGMVLHLVGARSAAVIVLMAMTNKLARNEWGIAVRVIAKMVRPCQRIL